MARSTEFADKNVLRAQTGFEELGAIGLAQVEQHVFRRRLVSRRHHIQPLDGIGLIAGAKLVEPLVRFGELRLKLDGYFRTDFVATAANRGPDGRDQVPGLGAELHLHPADGFHNDALERAAPSCMHSRNGALFRIHYKNRDTIRSLHAKQQTGTLGR